MRLFSINPVETLSRPSHTSTESEALLFVALLLPASLLFRGSAGSGGGYSGASSSGGADTTSLSISDWRQLKVEVCAVAGGGPSVTRERPSQGITGAVSKATLLVGWLADSSGRPALIITTTQLSIKTTRSFSIGRGWLPARSETGKLRMSMQQGGTMATKSSYSSSFCRYCCYGKTGWMLLVVAVLWMLLRMMMSNWMTWETNGMGGAYLEAPACVKELIRKDRPMTVHRLDRHSPPAEDAAAGIGDGDRGSAAAMLVAQYYYLVTPPCCDRFTTLYDAVTCQRICSPSGGLTGTGDGKCPPDVYDHTTAERIWKRKKSWSFFGASGY